MDRHRGCGDPGDLRRTSDSPLRESLSLRSASLFAAGRRRSLPDHELRPVEGGGRLPPKTLTLRGQRCHSACTSRSSWGRAYDSISPRPGLASRRVRREHDTPCIPPVVVLHQLAFRAAGCPTGRPPLPRAGLPAKPLQSRSPRFSRKPGCSRQRVTRRSFVV